jgi:hypothetical protein
MLLAPSGAREILAEKDELQLLRGFPLLTLPRLPMRGCGANRPIAKKSSRTDEFQLLAGFTDKAKHE